MPRVHSWRKMKEENPIVCPSLQRPAALPCASDAGLDVAVASPRRELLAQANNALYAVTTQGLKAADQPDTSEATSHRVERVVAKLHRICRGATLDFAVAVGRLVVTDLYAGDLDRWRTRNAKKEPSLRALAKHPNLPMSASALYHSIAIFEVCERLGIGSWKHVSTTHIRLALPLPSHEQARLLREAEAGRWTTQRLDNEIASIAQKEPLLHSHRGGRKRLSPLRERMRVAATLLSTIEEMLDPNGDVVGEPSPDSTRNAIALIRRMGEACVALETSLTRHLGDSSEALLPAITTAKAGPLRSTDE